MLGMMQDQRLGLSKTEMKRLMANMPVDVKTGSIQYSKFKETFTEGKQQPDPAHTRGGCISPRAGGRTD